MNSTIANAKQKRASIKDVAELAGTSTATASRALSKRGYVSKEARTRVLEAASKLKYQPNLQARGLRQRSSSTIGLLIPNLQNAYYTALADSLTQMLHEQGYYLLLSSTRDDPDLEEGMLTDMVGYAVEGLFWVPTQPSETLLSYLKVQNTPAVSLVRRVQNETLDAIIFEDLIGSETAMKHILSLGHQRIAFIGGDTRHSSNYDRWQGYLLSLKKAGLSIDNNLVKIGATVSRWGEAATNDLLQLPKAPTAIFVASNAIMPGVLKVLRQNRIRLPDQMSLVCFDDLDWFSYSIPSITAITSNHEKLAKKAVELMMNRIAVPRREDELPTLINVGFELIQRDSTVPPQIGDLK